MSTDAVVITGCGVVTPLAHSAAQLAQRILQQETALGSLGQAGHREVIGAKLDEVPLDSVPEDNRTRIGRLDRLCRLFLAAAYRAVQHAKLVATALDAEKFGLSFGTGLGCLLTNAEFFEKIVASGPAAASPRLFAYTVSSAAAGEVSIALNIKGPNLTTHAGTAAGLQAIGYGADLIAAGKADVMLCGGADALGLPLLQGLVQLGAARGCMALPFEEVIPGVNPSEGSAVMVLESAAHARRRNATVLAKIEAYAMGSEPAMIHAAASQPTIAAAAENTIRQALRRAGRSADEVTTVIASAHGTALDAAENSALNAIFPNRPRRFTPKSAWGECWAASGALGVALAASLRTRLAVVNALCYSGPIVSLLLSSED